MSSQADTTSPPPSDAARRDAAPLRGSKNSKSLFIPFVTRGEPRSGGQRFAATPWRRRPALGRNPRRNLSGYHLQEFVARRGDNLQVPPRTAGSHRAPERF